MMLRKLSALTAGVMIAALSLGNSAAHAQLSKKGGPVATSGDSMEAIDAERVQIWDGRVEILQDTTRLRADQVKIFHDAKPGGSGWGEVGRMEATGNLYFVNGDQVIKGDKAIYTRADDTMVVTGDVIVTQGENVMTGNRLVYNVAAGRTSMDAVPGSASKGRVRAVLYPDNKPAKTTAQ